MWMYRPQCAICCQSAGGPVGFTFDWTLPTEIARASHRGNVVNYDAAERRREVAGSQAAQHRVLRNNILTRPLSRSSDVPFHLASSLYCSQAESTPAPAPCFASANRWVASN